MPEPRTAADSGPAGILAPFGTLVAFALPFVAFSLDSPDALREAKVAAQALGASLVLLGLLLAPGRETAPGRRAGAARVAAAGFAVFLAFFAASFVSGAFHGRDPYAALPLLAALALFGWGATRGGEESAGRALGVLAACGAFTGLLAALQRFAGLFRLPVEAPEPRFFASALIGNPGDVGASVVIPGLVAASAFARGRNRPAAAAALACCVAGLAAASTIAPLVAFAAGAAALVLVDPARRLRPALAAGAAALALLAATGVVERVTGKLASGDLSTLTTQRDIGILSAMETIRAHPVLGVGPGGFASDFVRARLAAEERWGRRLSHRSASAHFDNAHCDPLTIAAEAGIPAALALGTAFAALLAGLARAAVAERDGASRDAVPAELLLAAVLAVLVLSLANFPVKIVPVSGPFAFLAGLAWVRVGGRGPTRRSRGAAAGLAVAALLLAAGSAARFASSRALAQAETVLRGTPPSDASLRASLRSEALSRARLAVLLRPRSALAHLALGSLHASRGDLPEAIREMELSRSLEERAETLLNLGRLAVATGRLEEARAFFLRAVWVQARLASAIPPAGEPDAVVELTREIEAALPKGGKTPAAPPGLTPR